MSAPMKTFKIRKVWMLIYTRTYVLSNKREQVPLINQRFAQSLIENEPFEELNTRLGNCIIYFVLRNHSLSFIPLSRSSVSYVVIYRQLFYFIFLYDLYVEITFYQHCTFFPLSWCSPWFYHSYILFLNFQTIIKRREP